MSESKTQKYRIEKVAPDGGVWGFLVAIGVAIPLASYFGCWSSFGLLFNDFIKNAGGGTSTVTIVIGLMNGASSCAGLFSNSLFEKFSMRSVGVFGAIVYFLGNFLTIFTTSIEYLLVTYGLMQGIGLGLIVPVAFAKFNQYFVHRRVFVMSLTQALTGVLAMIYPIFVAYLNLEFGFRGSVAIITAINAHVIFSMLVMHPVEWHYKLIKTPIVDEEKPLMNGKSNDINANLNGLASEKLELDIVSDNLKSKSHHSVIAPISMTNSIEEIIIKAERSKSLDPTQHVNFETIKRRQLSLMSVGDWNGVAISPKNYECNKKGKLQKVVDFLDLTLLKDWIYLNIVLGISFALYSDNSFFALLPLYLFELKFTPKEAAYIVAVGAAADLCSRLFLALVSFFIQVKARHIYLIGAVAPIFLRFVFFTIDDFIGMAVMTAILGFFRTFVHVPIPLVFGEYLPQERFASGYGLFYFFQGSFAFIMGPLIGWIRDVTHSFLICFNSLSFIMGLCAIPWIIELIWSRIYSKKDARGSGVIE